MNAHERWKTHDRLRRITDPSGSCRTPRNGQLVFAECGAGLDGNTVDHVRMRLAVRDQCAAYPGRCQIPFRVFYYRTLPKDEDIPPMYRWEFSWGPRT